MSYLLLIVMLLQNPSEKLNAHPPAAKSPASHAQQSGAGFSWTATTPAPADDDAWKNYRPTCFVKPCGNVTIILPSRKVIATIAPDGTLTIAEGHTAEELVKWLLLAQQQRMQYEMGEHAALMRSLERIDSTPPKTPRKTKKAAAKP